MLLINADQSKEKERGVRRTALVLKYRTRKRALRGKADISKSEQWMWSTYLALCELPNRL